MGVRLENNETAFRGQISCRARGDSSASIKQILANWSWAYYRCSHPEDGC